MAALSSAYNGIVGNPFFTGVLATEYRIGNRGAATYLVWNLVAASWGISSTSSWDSPPLPG